jgi:hypothetical protein
MKTIASFFLWVANLFEALGVCATVGFLAGSSAGFILMMYQISAGVTPVFTLIEVFQVSLLLWVGISLCLLFFLYVICRYTLGSIFPPTLFNTFVTCLLTTWFVNQFHLWHWAFFAGAVVGILIGKLLCISCNLLNKKIYGMH